MQQTHDTSGLANEHFQEPAYAPDGLDSVYEFFDFDSAASTLDPLVEYESLLIPTSEPPSEGLKPQTQDKVLRHVDIRLDILKGDGDIGRGSEVVVHEAYLLGSQSPYNQISKSLIDGAEEHQVDAVQSAKTRNWANQIVPSLKTSSGVTATDHNPATYQPRHLGDFESSSKGSTPRNAPFYDVDKRVGQKKAHLVTSNSPGSARFAVWDPNIRPNLEKNEAKITKSRKLSTLNTRRKPSTSHKGLRKRAPNGAICVRCRLQKGKCVGGFPCDGCTNKVMWKNICVRAKPDHACFLKGSTQAPVDIAEGDVDICVEVYRTRVNVMLGNVQRWIPEHQEPLVPIRVGIGFRASLPVKVNKFIPVDSALLEQASFRKSAEVEIPLSPWRVGPYGLHGSIISHADLDKFMEDMIPELLRNESQNPRDNIWPKTLTTAHQRSQNSSRKDSRILRNVLKMWAAQTSYAMDHMWRVSEGAGAIDSKFHSGLGGAVVPRCLMWQLDAVMEDYLHTLEQRILADFEQLIFPPRDKYREQSTWLSTYLAAYIYLACLETDTWIVQSWRVKTKRWKLEPAVANNPTMQWPLKEDPSFFVEKNTQQAREIVGHLRALSQGRLPFAVRNSDNVNGVRPNINSPDEDTQAFARSFGSEFIELAQKLGFRSMEPYREHDEHSLEYIFLSKLLIHEE